MAKAEDWYPNTQAGENEMYEAILANIEDVDATLQMQPDKKTRLMEMAQVFIEFYEKMQLNRAAVKSLGTAFSTVMKGKKGEDPMPALPEFHKLALIAGDFVGMESEMREMRRYMTGLFTWTESMGDVLKMNGIEHESRNPDEMSPSLNLSDVQGNAIRVRTRKEGMDGIEYQWRVAGASVWQPLTNSGEAETVLEIPIEAGTAQKIEIRAIFLKKFKRVGNWSPTYNAAVGS